MQKKPTSFILYKLLFPVPSAKDPRDFDDFIARMIVPEIRNEIISYYGYVPNEMELETMYPGWDYTKPKVRMRLGRYPCHKRLFRAFEKADLSDYEIDTVATWFGSKHERRMHLREWGGESDFEDYSDEYSA